MDTAARNGIDVIISFPQINDSTELAAGLIKDHPALFADHLKDKPDTSDFEGPGNLSDKIGELDPSHHRSISLSTHSTTTRSLKWTVRFRSVLTSTGILKSSPEWLDAKERRPGNMAYRKTDSVPSGRI